MLLLCFLDKSPLDKVKRTLKMEKKKKRKSTEAGEKQRQKKERNTINEKGIL